MSYKQNQEKMTVSSTGKVSTASVSDDLTTTVTTSGIYRDLSSANGGDGQGLILAAYDGPVGGQGFIRLFSESATDISGNYNTITLHSSSGYQNTISSTGGGAFALTGATTSINGSSSLTLSGATVVNLTSATGNINFNPSNTQRVQFTNTSPYAYKTAGGVWGTLSDSRLKKSITEINGALDKILTLHPVHYEFINQGETTNPTGTRTGFIAQEFEQVLPGHTFETEPMAEADKHLLGEGVKAKGIEADLVPYLVKAIQELKAELDTVKAELATLKG